MKRRLISVCLVLCMCFSLFSGTVVLAEEVATSGTCGESVTWSFDEATGTLTISGEGEMEDYTSVGAPWYSLRTSIKEIVFEEGVTSIGANAFRYCSNIATLTIPDGVSSIEDSAFNYCTSLSYVRLPKSVDGIPIFSGCSNLTTAGPVGGGYSIEFAWDESIPDYAFSGRSTLNSITLPVGITTIGEGAFFECENLSSVTLPEGLISIGEYAFEMCENLSSIVIPDGVTSIGEGAFWDCVKLESAVIPGSVKEIGGDIFSGCDALKSAGPIGGEYDICFGWTDVIPADVFGDCDGLSSVELPDGIVSIGAGAFSSCNNLTNIEIPNSVETIGASAFANTGLTSFEIPDSITSVAGRTFYGCTSLADVSIPDSVATIGANAFAKTGLQTIDLPDSISAIASSTFYGCTSLTDVIIPDSVGSIGASAFAGCTALNSIEIPDSVETIESSAFANCSSLETIAIPDSVTSMGSGVFANCTSLEYVELSHNVTNIYSRIFSGCSALKEIEIPLKVESIGASAFQNCSSLSSIAIPTVVDYVGISAFEGCTALTNLEIQGDDVGIDNRAFYGCTALSDVSISGSVGYIGEEAFYGCSAIEKMTLTEGLETIGSYGFYGTNLSEVILPESLKTLETYAFGNCTNLSYVLIKSGELELAPNAFRNCSNLNEVYFNSNAPTVSSTTLFPDGTTLYYVEGTTGWTDSEYYDATTGTWQGYTLKTWDGVSSGEEDGGETGDSGDTGTSGDDTVYASALDLDKTTLSLTVGESDQITATVQPSDYSGGYTWSSSNEDVLTVSSDGTVTAVGTGTATVAVKVQVSTTEILVATCTITVPSASGSTVEEVGDVIVYLDSDADDYYFDDVDEEGNTACDLIIDYVYDKFAIDLENDDAYLMFYDVNEDAAGILYANDEEELSDTEEYYDTDLNNFYFVADGNGSYEAEFDVYLWDDAVGDYVYVDSFILQIIVPVNDVVTDLELSCCSTGYSSGYTFETTDFDAIADVAFVTFGTPSSGALYADYANGSGTTVTGDTKFYTTNSTYGTYPVSSLTYVPETNFVGEVTIAYTATTVAGKTYEGTITMTVTKTASENESEDLNLLNFDLKWVGASLTLTDNIAINYRASVTAPEGIAAADYEVGALFWLSEPENYSINNAPDVNILQSGDNYRMDGDYHVFTYDDIAAKEMNDTLYSVVYVKMQGRYIYSTPVEYSVAKFAVTVVNGNYSDEFKTLAVDMLNYGAQAQLYFDYNTDNLANAVLTEEQLAYGTQGDVELTSSQKFYGSGNSAVAFSSASLTLENAVWLNYKASIDDSSTIDTVELIYDDSFTDLSDWESRRDTLTTITMEDTGTLWSGSVENIAAKDLRNDVFAQIKVTYADGTVAYSNVLQYSVESFAYAAQQYGSDGLVALTQSLLKYGDAAKAYFLTMN